MSAAPKHRIWALLIYSGVLIGIQLVFIDSSLLPNEKALWLYNGFASLLLGTRLLNPHFTPPADATTNSFVALSSILVASLAFPTGAKELILVWGLSAFCALIFLGSVTVLLVRLGPGLETRSWVIALERAVRGLGSPNFIFTIIVLGAVWLFHKNSFLEVFVILTSWSAIVAFKPVEAIFGYVSWIRERMNTNVAAGVIGLITARQVPNITLVRQSDSETIDSGTVVIVPDENGPTKLGIAINYVGRDEGNLLRILTLPVPTSLAEKVDTISKSYQKNIAFSVRFDVDELSSIPESHAAYLIKSSAKLCGIVDQDTSLDFLMFEVTNEDGLTEGRLVETTIGKHTVMYQVIEGITREEVVHQKNRFGYVRAKARKIGKWDEKKEKFMPVKWLPTINSPVFLKDSQEFELKPAAVGHFPHTNYHVEIDTDEAVTHNTAILGILGVGKTFLGIELIERMISKNIKVICLDLTNQYQEHLNDFIDADYEEGKLQELRGIGGRGAVRQNVEEGGSRIPFKQMVIEQIREFAADESPHRLKIFNPTQFEVWRQDSKPYNGEASMVSLTACEVTAIISDAALTVSQELGMTTKARICLVYEEAHSLVPEWNSVAADGDKNATATSARAILQGRKYGLGCLLITQRTANVTKTILNQCNTIFAMRTFDDTGKNFLANYIGSDYSSILSNIESRHAVVFGKASSCENPVLIRLNDRDDFVSAFRPENTPAEED